MSAPSDGNLPIGRVGDLFPRAKSDFNLDLSNVLPKSKSKFEVKRYKNFAMTFVLDGSFEADVTALTEEDAVVQVRKALEDIGIDSVISIEARDLGLNFETRL